MSRAPGSRSPEVRICDLGIGDDDADIEEDYDSWKKKHLLPSVRSCGVRRAAGCLQKSTWETTHNFKETIDDESMNTANNGSN